jgi:hypothetical protein
MSQCYWYITEAFLVLGKNAKDTSVTFGKADLIRWSSKFPARKIGAQMALDQFLKVGMARLIGDTPVRKGRRVYALTSEGIAAAKAACEARWSAGRVLGGKHSNLTRERLTDTFVRKLWALLRMRQSLTGPEAAATLVDAGGDVKTATRTASQYLRNWSLVHPDAIQVSKQKVGHAYRFVLTKDLGPEPPVVSCKQRVHKREAAQ